MGESVKKLMFVGDAACGSGFGKATHYILEILKQRWQVFVVGVNYRGFPHKYTYPIYPAWAGGDGLGVGMMKEAIEREGKPDLVVLQTNPWNVPIYKRTLFKHGYGDVPIVAIVAIEGRNCSGYELNGLKKAIFWTEFGRREATEGGMKDVPTAIVPLGVDLDVFKPGDQAAARNFLMPPGTSPVQPDSFIICNVNRNQNRKRIDLSVLYFSEWIRTRGIKDAYLYLHILPGSSTMVDCDQLATYCGTISKLIVAQPKDIYHGAPEAYVVAAYRASDIGLSTALGEGWGLTTMEGMACGKPQIATRYSAIAEWGRDAVTFVKASSEGVMPDVCNMIGGVPDKEEVLAHFDYYYENRKAITDDGEACRQLVSQPQYRWETIGQRFAEEIENA